MYHPKSTCKYGKTIQKYYLNHHLQTQTHDSKPYQIKIALQTLSAKVEIVF
jgi:hypothetical protein